MSELFECLKPGLHLISRHTIYWTTSTSSNSTLKPGQLYPGEDNIIYEVAVKEFSKSWGKIKNDIYPEFAITY